MSVFCTDFFMKDNQTIKRKKHLPLAASVIIGCSLFIVTLSVISSFVSYNVSKNTLYQRYQAQMSSIIDTIEGYVDHDDMYQCVQTNVESEKYKETQKVFDSFAEKYSDLHYIYILRPVDDARGVLSVISGNTAEEYKTDEAVHLGDGGEGWYTDEAIRQLNEIYAQDNDVFFFEDSEMWGKDYTLARPVSNSLGQKYGLLCVDISVETIDKSIGQIVMYSLSIILGVGLFFTGALIAWMYFFVIRPVRKLQKSVTNYANSSHNNNNPEQLTFIGPKVLASKEILELSESVEKMSNDMKNYVVNIIEKEEEVQTLHTSIEEMDVVAYQDALTGVKNKAAYDRDTLEITNRINKGEKVEFAVVMVDVNDLKGINDTYGHDSGDIYIKGACEIVCEIYKRSPVYRIGGDEIVVILQGEDYRHRDTLLEKIRKKFIDISHKDIKEEYKKYSAAVGMAVFDKDMDDEIYYSVFRRADKQMYANKADMKKQ